MELKSKILYFPNRKTYYDAAILKMSEYNNIAIWGAARGGERLANALKKNAIKRNCFFVDNSSQKAGKTFCDLPVYLPEKLLEYSVSDIIVVITCAACDKVIEQIKEMRDLHYMIYDAAWNEYDLLFEAFFADNYQLFQNAYSLLEDEKSKNTFAGVINYRINHATDLLDEIVSENEEYFDEELISLRPNEVYVDGGAYIGDTLLRFIEAVGGNYKKAICFEPYFQNMDNLKNNVEQRNLKNVVCEMLALSDADENGFLDINTNNGAASCFISNVGTLQINKTALDNYAEAQDTTFIKLDVEGHEFFALKGARETIRRNRPLLAVCVYHRYDDFFKIPLLIKEIVPDYNVYFRHYSHTAFETVCYAIPKEVDYAKDSCVYSDKAE